MKRAARFLFALFAPRGKFTIAFLVFLLIWPMFIPLMAHGQNQQYVPPPTYQTTSQAPQAVPQDENTAMQTKVINLLSAFGCQLTGINPAYDRPCVGVDKLTGELSFIPKEAKEQEVGGGAIGFVNTMMISMYAAPAASTGDYLAHMGSEFGLVKKAHAQGVGFTSLTPVLPLWTAARDVAYLFYIVVFIIVGILIMIRVRIDPRTVMTIQNQIPKIVIGIILITFSYAIAGFLIDIMYTSMYVITNVATSVPIPNDPATRERLFAEGTDGRNPETEITYADIGLGNRLIQATNPVTAAGNLYESDGWGPDAIRGIGVLSWKPAAEVGEAIGGIFNNPLGDIVNTGLMAIATTLILKNIPGAPTAGAASYLPFIAGAFTLASFLPLPGAQIIGPLGAGLFAAGPLLLKSKAQSWGSFGGASRKLAWGGAAVAVGGLVGASLYGLSNNDESIAEMLFSVIAFIIIAVAILSALIRLWFSLMKAYILILLNIIFAPFYILFGLFPGSGWSFNTWMRTMVSHLSAFPTVIILFLLGRIIIDGLGGTQSEGLFVPPLLGNASVSDTIQAIVGLTIILVAPGTVDMVRGIFHSKPSPYTGPAINPGVAAGVAYTAGLVRNPVGILQQAEEARWDVDTGGYQKVGTTRAVLRKFLG